MSGIFGEISYKFKYGSILTKLILINAGIFIVVKVTDLFSFLAGAMPFSQAITDFFALYANLSYLILHPWGIFTYMFMHQGFFHILFNLLWLYWFGVIFLNFLDEKRFLRVYIWGGLTGAAFFVLAYNIFPGLAAEGYFARVIGSSAAVLAIVTAISAYMPDYVIYLMFIGPVRIKYVAIVTILIDLISIPYGANAGGHIAHLGGALYGYLFAINMKRGRDITALFSVSRGRKTHLKVKRNRYKTRDDWEYNAIRKEDNEKLDRILDKIAKSGYDSLTEEEKRFLFESSKRN